MNCSNCKIANQNVPCIPQGNDFNILFLLKEYVQRGGEVSERDINVSVLTGVSVIKQGGIKVTSSAFSYERTGSSVNFMFYNQEAASGLGVGKYGVEICGKRVEDNSDFRFYLPPGKGFDIVNSTLAGRFAQSLTTFTIPMVVGVATSAGGGDASVATVGHLNTNNTESLPVSESESFGQDISLHKVSKTGRYEDLSGKPDLTNYYNKTEIDEIVDGITPGEGGGGDENVIETIMVNGAALEVSNKAVDIPVPNELKDLGEDTTHRTVTDAEKQTWNGKSNFSGDYEDLTNKPTIPDVPSWAMQSSKPSYTPQEVGALPASTPIPSKTSDLTNDSGFLTAHQDISGKEDKLSITTPTITNNALTLAVSDLGKFFKLGTLTANTVITLPNMANEDVTHIVGCIFDVIIGTNGSIDFNATQDIYENGLSNIEDGKRYEINVIYATEWRITAVELTEYSTT